MLLGLNYSQYVGAARSGMTNRDLRVMAMSACTSVLLAACTGLSDRTYAYKLYPGSPRPSSEIAIVRLGDAQSCMFDGRPVRSGDWTEVHLLPGEHWFEWIRTLYSPPVTQFATTLALEAGHVYSLKMSTTGWSERFNHYWVIDNSTGEIVAGPHRSPER
jgi:hypothetical protein